MRYRAVRRSAVDGENHHLDISFVPERDETGAVLGFYALKLDVTSEERAEQAMRKSEELLRLATDGGGVGIWEWDIASDTLSWNAQLKRIFGLPVDVTGLTLDGFVAAIHAEDRNRVEHDFRSALERKTEFDCEYRIVCPDGTVRWIAARGHGDYNEAGEARRMIGMAIDTTERRLSEAALRESEARFRHLFEQVPTVAVQGYAPDGTVIFWNKANESVYGYSREEVMGRSLYELIIPPAMRDEVRSAVRQMADTGVGEPAAEIQLMRKDGSPVPVYSSHVVLENAAGQKELYCLDVDLTERKRIEDELRQSEHKFSRVFHNSPIPIAITRLADGRYVDINDAFVRLFGWTREEAIGRSSVELGKWLRPEDRQAWVAEIRRSGRVEGYEFQLRDKQGRILPVLFSAETIELDGEPSVLVLAVDLSERKKTEAVLQESEARLREAQRIGRVGSWDLDIVSKRIAFSPELYLIYEREPGAFGGSFEGMLKLVHPDDLPKIRRAWHDSARAKGSYEMEHRILAPDGRVKYLHVRWEVFRDAAGKPTRALGTAQDITEQVLAKAEIQRLNERLEIRVRERTAELLSANKELESFAYSISHDLRAPLRGIDGFGQLLLEEYGERLDAQGHDYLKRMRSAAQRMGTLIDDILELSRVTRKSMGREAVDLSRLAADILDNKAKSDPQRQVETSVAPGCTANGDAQLLRILLENLIENAWKYSRNAAPARIEFGQEDIDGEQAFVVRDNGVGFDMRYAGRLFAPFQRLHKPEEFEGTGIGLASAARIVHRHGGRIWAEAETGKGATLRFTLSGSEQAVPE